MKIAEAYVDAGVRTTGLFAGLRKIEVAVNASVARMQKALSSLSLGGIARGGGLGGGIGGGSTKRIVDDLTNANKELRRFGTMTEQQFRNLQGAQAEKLHGLGSLPKNAKKALGETMDHVGKFGRWLQYVGSAMIRSFVWGAIRWFRYLTVGTAAAFAFIEYKAVRLGMAFVEMRNLTRVTFGNMSADAIRWAQTYAASVKLDPAEIERGLSTFNNMIRSMGFGADAALMLSKGLMEIRGDISSLRNIPLESAFEKISSGLVGMPRPLQDIGILVNEQAAEMELLANGIEKVGGEYTNQQKVIGRYLALLKATVSDRGDLLRTMYSEENILRSIGAAWTGLLTTLGISSMKGEGLKELLLSFRLLFENLADKTKDLGDWWDKVFRRMADWVIVLDVRARQFANTLQVIVGIAATLGSFALISALSAVPVVGQIGAAARVGMMAGKAWRTTKAIAGGVLAVGGATQVGKGIYDLSVSDARKEIAARRAELQSEMMQARKQTTKEAMTEKVINEEAERYDPVLKAIAKQKDELKKAFKESFMPVMKSEVITGSWGFTMVKSIDKIATEQKRKTGELARERLKELNIQEKQIDILKRQAIAQRLVTEAQGINTKQLAESKKRLDELNEKLKITSTSVTEGAWSALGRLLPGEHWARQSPGGYYTDKEGKRKYDPGVGYETQDTPFHRFSRIEQARAALENVGKLRRDVARHAPIIAKAGTFAVPQYNEFGGISGYEWNKEIRATPKPSAWLNRIENRATSTIMQGGEEFLPDVRSYIESALGPTKDEEMLKELQDIARSTGIIARFGSIWSPIVM